MNEAEVVEYDELGRQVRDTDSASVEICGGKIVVQKETTPDGSAQVFDFSPDYGDAFTLTDGQSHESDWLLAGTYAVTEASVTGWDAASTCSDGSPVTAIELAAGEVVTCTFTNVREWKSYLPIISKNVKP